MASTLRRCRFFFVDDPTYDGFTDGSTWNGFANVWVTPAVRDQIATDYEAFEPGSEHAAELRALAPESDGLISLAYGYAAELEEVDP